MTDDGDEAALAAWWCANAGRYREEADRFGWRPRFDAAASDVEAGLPLRDVLDKHRLPGPRSPVAGERAMGGLDGLGIPEVPVSGDYVCPRESSCGRSAQADADTGVEPRCDIAGHPMRFRPGRNRR